MLVFLSAKQTTVVVHVHPLEFLFVCFLDWLLKATGDRLGLNNAVAWVWMLRAFSDSETKAHNPFSNDSIQFINDSTSIVDQHICFYENSLKHK